MIVLIIVNDSYSVAKIIINYRIIASGFIFLVPGCLPDCVVTINRQKKSFNIF